MFEPVCACAVAYGSGGGGAPGVLFLPMSFLSYPAAFLAEHAVDDRVLFAVDRPARHAFEPEAKALAQPAGALVPARDDRRDADAFQRLERIGEQRPQCARQRPARIIERANHLDVATAEIVIHDAADEPVLPDHAERHEFV